MGVIRVGDIIRYKDWITPFVVTGLNGTHLKTTPLGYGSGLIQTASKNLCKPHTGVLTEKQQRDLDAFRGAEKKEDKKMDQLYQWKIDDNIVYGHKLTVDSQGRFVMEAKGSGVIVAVHKDSVEEVHPPTIGVQFVGSENKTYNYLYDGKNLNVGDLLLVNSLDKLAHVLVKEVNGKSKMASKYLDIVGRIPLDKTVVSV